MPITPDYLKRQAAAYLSGVQDLDAKIAQLQKDRLATLGAVDMLNKLIAEAEKPEPAEAVAPIAI